MTDDVFFFDSYAIIEIIKGNENYRKFANARILTTKLNLFELFYYLLRIEEKEADKFLKLYYQYVVDFDEIVIKEASKLKIQNKKLSMADCIGYILAAKMEIKFLTGDREFEGMENVEFMK